MHHWIGHMVGYLPALKHQNWWCTPSPSSAIWWWLLETCSNFFIWGPTLPIPGVTSGGSSPLVTTYPVTDYLLKPERSVHVLWRVSRGAMEEIQTKVNSTSVWARYLAFEFFINYQQHRIDISVNHFFPSISYDTFIIVTRPFGAKFYLIF